MYSFITLCRVSILMQLSLKVLDNYVYITNYTSLETQSRILLDHLLHCCWYICLLLNNTLINKLINFCTCRYVPNYLTPVVVGSKMIATIKPLTTIRPLSKM